MLISCPTRPRRNSNTKHYFILTRVTLGRGRVGARLETHIPCLTRSWAEITQKHHIQPYKTLHYTHSRRSWTQAEDIHFLNSSLTLLFCSLLCTAVPTASLSSPVELHSSSRPSAAPAPPPPPLATPPASPCHRLAT